MRSQPQPRLHESSGLFETERQVHVLHCLTRSTLDQVVLDYSDNQPIIPTIEMNRDVEEVGSEETTLSSS